MSKPRGRSKPFAAMNADELARATAEFDQEYVIDTFKPPSRELQARWNRVKRGRPTVGRGAKVISVSVEKGLLQRADRLAKKKGITRARLIARGLRAVLAAEGADETH